MIYSLSEAIRELYNKEVWRKSPPVEDAEHVVNFISSRIKENKIGVVQGPPGTRKTLLMFVGVDKVLDQLDSDEVILYVAPTNALVYHAVKYFTSMLYRKGCEPSDVVNLMRVFGSQFTYSDDVKRLRDIADSETKIIFTTPYQVPHMVKKNVHHLLIDEASRMKLHEGFMSLRRRLIELVSNDERFHGSMVVAGDPMQAIVLPKDYREYQRLRQERLLLENIIAGMLSVFCDECKDLSDSSSSIKLTRLARKHLKGKWFEFLDTTYRLPRPTESPISVGFYDGELKGKFTFEERLRDLQVNVERELHFGDRLFDELSQIVFDSLSSSRPIIVLETGHDWIQMRQVGNLEPTRSKIAAAMALTLASYGFKTTVVTAYRDQAVYTKLIAQSLKKHLTIRNDVIQRVQFINVHRILGGEDDAIVVVLGKEYALTSGNDEQTIYFNEFEVLNVQLSRHRGLLVVVGDPRLMLRKAREFRYSKQVGSRILSASAIEKTMERLLELVGVEKTDLTKSATQIGSRESDFGLFKVMKP